MTKKIMCPNCYRRRKNVADNMVLCICPACQCEMEEIKEVKNDSRRM